MKTKLLFICSRNQWRSPTAEALFKGHARYDARSAGTEERARIKVTAGHIGWADVIFCMERKHAERLRDRFEVELEGKPLVVLRIPDNYQYGDPELIEILKSALVKHIEW